ncbi:unnamed protein product [Effrenium voratum]|uniref:Vacuolar protein sorting-associated protein 35 n=1 Tax=Effrenium voratum TaxID=2562239 RepID=A0AA36I9C9_9DINO|nr:unnamed protein product [Effrenium voratum]CAJ1419130.1 unnamed protein product [Effrenium voratum]
MAAAQGYPAGGADDQERLLDEATAVVKEQAFYMKKAIDSDNVREALKNASNMICELRTSLLLPKNYFELYMQVFSEMQHLSGFFADKNRHKKKMIDLYESVQHAGNILPRLYLLATVAAAYIKSLEAPAKEILKDVNELCKGVQHPLRGLFLRYYLSQMLKDKLPDTGSGFEGEGGDINDAFEFIFTNFNESNRLWVRIQHQGPAREKDRRERERHDLRVLVGANLVRLSQLDGMTMEFYAETALPKILDHIVSVKDTMSQQYLLESMIQVFPDEFHIRTLEQMLSAYARALPSVDMKPIMVTLMNRLANFLAEADKEKVQSAGDIFTLFRSHLQGILERALQPQGTGTVGVPDMAPPLEVLAAFMQFTVSLYPDQVHYVDIILGSAAELMQKFRALPGCGGALSDKAADQIGELLAGPMKTLGLGVLKMEHFAALVSFLNFEARKQVSLSMVTAIVEDNRSLSSVEDVKALFTFISPLLKDEEDTPLEEGKDKVRFAEDQQKVCKLVHQVRHEDTDVEYQMLTEMRGFFGQGGPQRLVFTLQPVFFAALGLVPKIQAREKRREQEGDEAVPPPAISMKKVFQFLHRTNSALMQSSPDIALQLWLTASVTADQVERATGEGNFEPIAYEFLTQALVLFEEEISDSSKQYKGIHSIVGTLCKVAALDPENFDNVSQKITRHAAKLLKKPMQCRAVSACSQLFWCDARREPKRVRECLERCVKTCEAVVQSDSGQVGLWVEMLDRYIYYFEVDCDEVTITFLQSLLQICVEHIDFAMKDPQSEQEAKKAKAHLQATMTYLKKMKESPDAGLAARFAELTLS